MSTPKNALPIGLYLVLVVLLSSVFWTLIILQHHVAGGAGRYVEALMWCPAVAAFLTVAIRKLGFNTLGLGWGPSSRYALLGYLTPLAYAAIAYSLIWLTGFGTFPSAQGIAALSTKLGWSFTTPVLFVPAYFIFMGVIGMISSVSHALGEEIGWRGFLAPRMNQSLGFTSSAVIVGLIWTAWHVPLLLFADYNNGTPWWFGLSCFAVMVVSISVMMTWIRLKSNSVWPCAILHASHNLFIQAIFTPLTGPRPDGLTLYAVGEFGLAVPAVAAVFAIGFWLKRKSAEAAAAAA
jgi:membrane protease YdiL (CAAX protease family)